MQKQANFQNIFKGMVMVFFKFEIQMGMAFYPVQKLKEILLSCILNQVHALDYKK